MPDPSQKKGISGLAIAGIGCGVLLLLVFIGGALLVMKGCQKVAEVASDFQKNPAKASATFMVKANPDLDLVKTDDVKGEITVRDKKTGEVMTLSFDEISKGRLTMKNAKGEQVSIDASGVSGQGSLVIKGPNGEAVIGSNQAPPSWVPAYPGLQAQAGGMRVEKGETVNGTHIAETTDAADKVKEFFESKLKADGCSVEATSSKFNDVVSASVTGTKEDGKLKISVLINSEKGKTSVIITYEGPKQ